MAYFDLNSLSEAYSNGVINDVGTGIEETKTNSQQTQPTLESHVAFESTAWALGSGDSYSSKWY